MDEPSSPKTLSGKRVVFVHPNGLHQIAGVLDEDLAPSHISGPFHALGNIYSGAKLSKVTDHAVYYTAEQGGPVAAPSGGNEPSAAAPSDLTGG